MYCIFVQNESLFLNKKLWKHRPLSITRLELEDTKGVIRNRISKRNRQHNGQRKRTNNDLQNIHKKLKIEEHEPY